jgi:anti-sigma factor RsiW
MTHLSAEQLEAFALGTMDPEGTRALAQHVSACPACARRLQAEAALEVLFRDVANAASAPVRVTPLYRRRSVVVGLALAAGLAGLFVWRAVPPRSTAPIELEGATVSSRGVICANGPTQADCMHRAQRRGLFVSYPPHAHTRYGIEEL